MEYSTNAMYNWMADPTIHALCNESMLLAHLQGDRPVGTKICVRPVEEPKADREADDPDDEWAESKRVFSEREHR